jgi:hypothetical protein
MVKIFDRAAEPVAVLEDNDVLSFGRHKKNSPKLNPDKRQVDHSSDRAHPSTLQRYRLDCFEGSPSGADGTDNKAFSILSQVDNVHWNPQIRNYIQVLRESLVDICTPFCHCALMETHAFGFGLRANLPEGQKRFPISDELPRN